MIVLCGLLNPAPTFGLHTAVELPIGRNLIVNFFSNDLIKVIFIAGPAYKTWLSVFE